MKEEENAWTYVFIRWDAVSDREWVRRKGVSDESVRRHLEGRNLSGRGDGRGGAVAMERGVSEV